MLFVPWWLVRLVNSVISFTLIVFTIPLAFDVGGRAGGMTPVRPRHVAPPEEMIVERDFLEQFEAFLRALAV